MIHLTEEELIKAEEELYKLSPILKHIIIRPIEFPRETESGILLPPTVHKETYFGEVMAVSKSKNHDDDIKVGDVVVYPKGAMESELSWVGGQIVSDGFREANRMAVIEADGDDTGNWIIIKEKFALMKVELDGFYEDDDEEDV